MTKSELIESLFEKLSDTLSKKDAELIVNIIFKEMSKALKEGDKIEIRGLGSFKIISRRSRIGRNPKSGEKVSVPEKKAVFFKPGKELKERADN